MGHPNLSGSSTPLAGLCEAGQRASMGKRVQETPRRCQATVNGPAVPPMLESTKIVAGFAAGTPVRLRTS